MDVYRILRIRPGQVLGFVHIWVVVPLMGMIFVQLVYSGVHTCRVGFRDSPIREEKADL